MNFGAFKMTENLDNIKIIRRISIYDTAMHLDRAIFSCITKAHKAEIIMEANKIPDIKRTLYL